VANPSVEGIVKAKEGRAVEAAICFSTMLKAVEVDSRIVFVSGSSEVVWVEYWSRPVERYVHVDPFTGVYNNPLSYEANQVVIDWVVAVGTYQVADVTKRYTQNLEAVRARRSEKVNEEWLAQYIAFANRLFTADLDPDIQAVVEYHLVADDSALSQLGQPPAAE
jgi:hypothetical protein